VTGRFREGEEASTGRADAAGLRIAVVASRTNGDVVERLLAGALETLRSRGAADEAIAVTRVPGAFELPLAAQWAAQSGRFDAVVALGAVIRGGTPHFEYICAEAARGLSAVALDTGVPVLFGVLTTNTREEALDRAGGSRGNKGSEAALAAIEMARLAPRRA
jgi:6,7-dimethyl-8-ribityllumazine synthase